MSAPIACPHYPGMPPNVCPSPPPFDAGPFASWFFLFFAGGLAVLVALPYALHRGFRRGTWMPLMVLAAGFLTCLVEPMLDFLGHLRWADDLPFVFSNFGLQIPWLIPFCYATFYGVEAYFFYLVFKHGVTVKQLMLLFPIGIVSDAIMETVGLNLHVYEYYGHQPFEFLRFPYWWGFINGAGFVTVGFFAWYLDSKLRGVNRFAILLAGPAGMMAVYFMVGWPHILAHNSTLPVWIRDIVAAMMMVGCVLWVRGIAYFVAVDEPRMTWSVGRWLAALVQVFFPAGRERMLDNMIAEHARKAGGASYSPSQREPQLAGSDDRE